MRTKQMALDALKHCNGNLNDPVQCWEIAIIEQAISALEADLTAKVEPVGSNGWLIDGSLLYRLEDGINCDEINVTQAGGSRDLVIRGFTAKALLDLIAKPKQAEAPAGFVLVPIEPTVDMLKAYMAVPYDEIDQVSEGKEGWKAMISAAPRPAP